MKDNKATVNVKFDETEEKKTPEIYLNIDLDGVTLPFGLALDTMPKAKISGSEEWQKLCLKKNKLLDALVALILDKCGKGETLEIPNLKVIARRANEKISDTNEKESDTFDFGV